MERNWLKTFKNITEYKQPIRLAVKSGNVPSTMHGTYYKCGPGVFHEHGSKVMHPFDGDGIVSAYRFANGRVEYQTRIVDTYHRSIERILHGRVFSGAFGTPPLMMALKNSANVNIIAWGGVLIVLSECGPPYVLDPETLDTLGPLAPFQEGLPAKTSYLPLDDLLRKMHLFGDVIGAHPKVIGDRLVLYTLQFGHDSTTITFYEIDENLDVKKVTPFVVEGFLYLHDFVVTPTHYVFFQHALKLNMQKLNLGIVNCLESTSGHGIAHSVSRNDGESAAAPIMGGFATHHSQLQFGAEFMSVMYPNIIDFKNMTNACGRLVKTSWKNGQNLEQKVIYDDFVEFPTCIDAKSMFACLGASSLGRFNNEGQLIQRWDGSMEETGFIGEPVLDGLGHVMSIIHDSKETKSVLAIFDAENLSSGPIAELWLPEHVPTTLHGCWESS